MEEEIQEEINEQVCTCGHAIDNHLEQVEGKGIAGECNMWDCPCKKYEDAKPKLEFIPIK